MGLLQEGLTQKRRKIDQKEGIKEEKAVFWTSGTKKSLERMDNKQERWFWNEGINVLFVELIILMEQNTTKLIVRGLINC